MRYLFAGLGLVVLIAAPALSEKEPVGTDPVVNNVECGLTNICWEWDGTFDPSGCDDQGVTVWEYGAATDIPDTDCDGNPVGDVLGTVLAGDYPSDAGDRAFLNGLVDITEECYLMEICHYYNIETEFDGGNVEVLVAGVPTVVSPVGGYPEDEISTSTFFYAWCVDGEPGFTGDSVMFVKDCFDLTQFIGQSVQIAVVFGSDASVTEPGWYIASVKIGGMQATPTEKTSWGRIKNLY